MDMSLEKNRILIVDDHAESAEILMGVLHDYAHQLAATGKEALKQARKSPHPDLILLDIVLPDMDGYEVCRMLKADPLTRDIPLIFVSVLEKDEQEAQGLELGAVDYITKPFQSRIVRARVHTHMKLARAHKELEKQKQTLEKAEKLAELGAWEWDMVNDTLHFSHNWRRIHGIPDSRLDIAELIPRLAHPDDAPRIEAAFEKAKAQGRYSIRHRIRRADTGEVRHIQAFGEVQVCPQTGAPVRMVGAAQDITAQVRQEERLKESEARYESLTRNLNGIAFRGTVNFEPIYFRGAVEAITGYSEADFISGNLTWDKLIHPEDLEWLLNDPAHSTAIQTQRGYATSREYRIVRKDGAIRWVFESIHNLSDESGRPVFVEGVLLDITEKKQAQSDLERARASLDALEDTVFWINEQGKFFDVNETVCRKYGYSRQEIRQMGPLDLIEKLPEGEWKAHWEYMRRQGQILREARHRTREGRYIPVEVAIHMQRFHDQDYIFAVARDITERRKAEDQLRKLWRAVENSPATLLITDTHGTIEYVNPAFTQITGYAPAEAIGQTPRILKSGIHEPVFYQNMWQTIVSGEVWRGEICNRKKDGTLYWAQAAIAPVKDENGEITHYLAVKEEITEQKELERIKADVDRIMRHDLKTPLNAIVGFPHLLKQDGNLSPNQLELINMMEESGHIMLDMIEMSLDMFKIETGQYHYSPENVDSLSVIEKLLSQNRYKLSPKNITTQILINGSPLSPDSHFWIPSEPALLKSMLSNLLTNAIEASPEGGAIRFELSDADPKVIAIHNQGAVPLAVRPHFFEKYKTEGKVSGTGLGTYSAKLMAEAMGYQIEMETDDAADTTRLRIHIPAGDNAPPIDLFIDETAL